MSNKKFINLKKKVTLSTALMMGFIPIAEVNAANIKGAELSNELQTLEGNNKKVDSSKEATNVSNILMEKDLVEKNEQLTKSIFRKVSSKKSSKKIEPEIKEKEINSDKTKNLNHKNDLKSTEEKSIRIMPEETEVVVEENDFTKEALEINEALDIKTDTENEDIYEMEFYHFTNSDSNLILNQDDQDNKIALPESLLATIIGENIPEENETEMFKIKVDKNRYAKSLLSNKDKNLDILLTILTKQDTDAIEVMKEVKSKNMEDSLDIDKLVDIFNNEDQLELLNNVDAISNPLGIILDNNDGITNDINIEEKEDIQLTDEDIESIGEKIEKIVSSLEKDRLYEELNIYLDSIEYKDTKENKGFIVGFVDKAKISKENKFEESYQKLYAHKDSPVFLENGNLEEIDLILSEESIEIIGENDQWYKVSLRDLYENYDELEVEDEYAIVEKENFQNKPIFHKEDGVLFAKQKVQLYNTPDESDESKYHVNKDGSIVQVEKALEWIKIELTDGTVLYAKSEDFDEVDSRGINKYQRTYTIAKKVVKPNYGGKSEGVVIQAPKNTDNPVGEDIVEFATQFVGNKYVWGGNSLTNGVDCSGFTKEVYKRYGVNLPRWSGHQSNVGKEVSLSEARPGDIVTYDGHVAIYMGNGKIVHAANKRKGIITSNVNYGKPIKSIRRVIE